MTKAGLSRRVFLGGTMAAGISLALYRSENKKTNISLYSNRLQVLLQAAYHLFPHSKLGPGAIDLHVSGYLNYVMQDERIMKEDRTYILQGAAWLEESAFEKLNRSFLNLDRSEKEKLFQQISQERWGEKFIYLTLNYVFEALLSAPIYGSNRDAIGWEWLEHNPGFPQPSSTKEISYEV